MSFNIRNLRFNVTALVSCKDSQCDETMYRALNGFDFQPDEVEESIINEINEKLSEDMECSDWIDGYCGNCSHENHLANRADMEGADTRS